MDVKKKIRKVAPPSSSSSSDSDSSSSSSSEEARRKQKRRNIRKQQRETSSSSEEETVKKSHKQHSHKKSSARKHSHAAKIRVKMVQGSGKKASRSMSPATRAAHKQHLKAKLAAKKAKLEQLEEHEGRSRRDVKKDRTPDHRISSPTTRIRVSVPNNRAVKERSLVKGLKDSPSSNRRHREPAGEKERAEILARCQERQRERERLRRIQEEEERYKHAMSRSSERPRILPTSEKHHLARSRSRSRGKIPIRERLDKDYEYHRSISREHEDYQIIRPIVRDPIVTSYARERPTLRDEPERSFDYRTDDRRMASHDFQSHPSRSSFPEDRGERHHRPSNWETNEREIEPRGNRMYESREWESAAHSKRIPEEPYKDHRDRSSSSYNDQQHDKWTKEKEPKEWTRSWKDPTMNVHHGTSSSAQSTMPHPRRWPSSSHSEVWRPRGVHPSSHKLDNSSPSSGPPFKPRYPGPGSTPHFGFKRFPFKRFPNQYSKINYPSKPMIPNAQATSSSSSSIVKMSIKTSDNSSDSPMKNEIDHLPLTPGKIVEATESGEITTEPEEDKVEADTTFSGNIETQSQEECEGNLSEFSDVDDEILNREEIDDVPSRTIDGRASSSHLSLRQPSNAHVNNRIFSPFSSDYYCIYGLLPRNTEDDERRELARGAVAELNTTNEGQNGDQNAMKIISKIHANKELKKEMDLDFEEISDGELEEESRIKGLGDALGVDWASLAKETQRPIKQEHDGLMDSTKSRWTSHRILWDIGVSAKLAGEDFARKVLTEARYELRKEKQERKLKLEQLKVDEVKSDLMNGDVKVEASECDEVKIKIEPKEETTDEHVKSEIKAVDESEDDFELDDDVLIHPLAQMQILMRKLQKKRKNLILLSTGKYGRALSARKDLKIRRQLCNLPSSDFKIDRSCIVNSEISKNVEGIYREVIGEVS
ncbi:CLUMA_CG017207, isoform A [Clunio marinus]|uniref:CLUMA_CG017207, isoform A n=1 Tax=Clunio marinus TaxID=568069 RepID=A0A1J1IY77_9DIPT|nr:CLUMA_CG017207, isoform A [Clunio marinus]